VSRLSPSRNLSAAPENARRWLTASDSRPAFFGILAQFNRAVYLAPVGRPRVGARDTSQPVPTSEWATIRQARSLGKVNWTASVISDPERPIKARAIPSAPSGPLNLFKPGVVKVVPEPQKQCHTGRHFNRAYLNSRKQAHAVLRREWVTRRYLRSRNVVKPGWVYTSATWDALNHRTASGNIKRGPTHWYAK
jgi:hypothetical protein